MRAWFDADPGRTGKELFHRLRVTHPGVFPDGQLRTLQRRLEEWRSAVARQLVFAAPEPLAAVGGSGTAREPSMSGIQCSARPGE